MSSSAKWRKHLMWNIFLANCSVKHILWTHILWTHILLTHILLTHILWNTFCETHFVKHIKLVPWNIFCPIVLWNTYCEILFVLHVQLVSWNMFLSKSQIVQWNISLSESNFSVKQYSNCSVKHICALIQIVRFTTKTILQYISQFGQVHYAIWTNMFCNVKYIHFVMWNIYIL